MRQRAKEFGGTLRLTNANPGTLIEIVIPARSFVPQKEHAIA
jgi:signal transduction histidine kinase